MPLPSANTLSYAYSSVCLIGLLGILARYQMDQGFLQEKGFALTLYHYAKASPVLSFCLIFSVSCILTRITSGLQEEEKIDSEGHRIPTAIPYWIPYIGHAISYATFSKQIFEKIRDRGLPIWSLTIAGRTHYIIASPSLIKAIFTQLPSSISSSGLTDLLLMRFFGASKDIHKLLQPISKEIHFPLNNLLLEESHLNHAISITVRNMELNVPNLVSFSPSLVDQSLWERPANVHVIDPTTTPNGTPTAEVSFYPLIRNFVAHMIVPALVGAAFVENFPDIFQDLWALDDAMVPMLAGLPRWFPLPSLPPAYAARRRLIAAMMELDDAINAEEKGEEPEGGFRWADLSDVSELIRRRSVGLRKAGATRETAAACNLAILWAATTTTPTHIFWILLSINTTPTENLSPLLRETVPHTSLSQPPKAFALPSPPILKIALNPLKTSCPRLLASHIEALRLYTAPTAFYEISPKQDVILDDKYVLKKGSGVHIPYNLCWTGFSEPENFHPERFLKDPEVKTRLLGISSNNNNDNKMNTETHQHYHYPSTTGAIFETEILAFTASILRMWDIVPIGGGPWEPWMFPGKKRTASGFVPSGDFRVWIRRGVQKL
ncbi:MAG: hypothetical protein M1834_000234 [Cirrosporium novae-zelandiae]|nr:MAG: hypothetical protein M1834_000234 [Cirrosporium novae-zelandiae]